MLLSACSLTLCTPVSLCSCQLNPLYSCQPVLLSFKPCLHLSACRCDVRGSVSGRAQCDPVSGDCVCKRLVTGRSCDTCLPEHWALSHDLNGCRSCECDVGGALDNHHMIGRQCSQVESGFFFMALDHLLYEAELSRLGQMPRDWEEVRVTVVRPGAIPTSSPCGNTIPDDDRLLLSLPATARFMVPLKPLCLEKGVSYTLRFEFRRYQDFHGAQDGSGHFILVDSIALMPRHSSMDMFSSGDAGAALRKQSYERYRCHDTARSVVRPVMSEACARLISSMSALIHDGALACGCSQDGSLSPLCDKFSGQCQCRSGAFGPRCDRCQTGHWGFPNCRPCQCNGQADECHQSTGACLNCRGNTGGEHCDRCANGFYGNPVLGQSSGGSCRPCPCPDGPNSGRHLPRPVTKTTGRARSPATANRDIRSRDSTANRVIRVRLKRGGKSPRCDQCAPGHHGNPAAPGGHCEPCQCHNNIDMSDPQSCDRTTGQCLKCLYHTEGRSCDVCRRGYYGDASRRNCRKCTCNSLGTDSSSCGSSDSDSDSASCSCQRSSGQCQCRPNVTGLSCDHCAANHWNLASGRGCESCDCDAGNSYSPTCNEFTGQCQCRSGFGGKTCTDCQENYWGDPRIQCRCDRSTGPLWWCRPWCFRSCVVINALRGFSGTFPNCEPCHLCFGDWDRIRGPCSACYCDLAVQTKSLSSRAHELQTTGLTGPYEKAFRELEEKLALALSIVQARNKTSAAVTLLMELIQELRTQISDTTDSLSRVEAELTVVQDTNTEVSSDLSALEREAREVNLTSEQLQRQLDVLKNSNFLALTARSGERRAFASKHAVLHSPRADLERTIWIK
ncbi:hypothetical protein WMY93_027100 [Mugilogobius chulae]|uniref:Uncharacterized protein n=1 Tax=Mugilogobius chulae TaxID=88201 RepID=A0AAW0N3S7_9GOBI